MWFYLTVLGDVAGWFIAWRCHGNRGVTGLRDTLISESTLWFAISLSPLLLFTLSHSAIPSSVPLPLATRSFTIPHCNPQFSPPTTSTNPPFLHSCWFSSVALTVKYLFRHAFLPFISLTRSTSIYSGPHRVPLTRLPSIFTPRYSNISYHVIRKVRKSGNSQHCWRNRFEHTTANFSTLFFAVFLSHW